MIILPILIFIFYIFIFLKLESKKRLDPESTTTKISIVVAAKNEELNIEELFKSLTELDYPKNFYEVIFVDDNSTDSTFNILSSLTEDISNFNVIKAIDKKYEGKRGALQIGIDASLYHNIVITDADCRVSSGLLKSYSGHFNYWNKFIFGVAPYTQEKSFVNSVACFDNFWVHLLTFSFSYHGLPYSAAARNMGFDKRAFNEVGGYAKTTDTLSGDDDLLLREVVKNKMKVGLITNKNAFVFSTAKQSFKELIQQKSRHTSTSNYYTKKVKFNLGVWHFVNYFMLATIFLIPLNIEYIYLILFKIIMDVFIVKHFMQMFSYKFSTIQIIYLQFTYELLLIVYFIKGLSSKTKW